MISNPPYPSSLLHATAFFFIFTKLIVIMEIFGKTLRDYLWPVKWYVIASVIVVVFQYEGMLATGYDPLMARITQWLWEIFVAAAVFTLVWKHDFGPKHIFFTGILFSVIIIWPEGIRIPRVFLPIPFRVLAVASHRKIPVRQRARDGRDSGNRLSRILLQARQKQMSNG